MHRRDRLEEGHEVRVVVDDATGRRAAESSAISASRRAKRSDSWWGRDRPVASVALAASSSSRCAISGTAYLAVSTSPCSVIFRRPRTVPGGSARIAPLVGPPPRPTAPPRPWKKHQLTPWRLSTSASRTWAV